MNTWILILIIKSNSMAAVSSLKVNSYKTCQEAGQRFEIITRDSRYLCIFNEQDPSN